MKTIAEVVKNAKDDDLFVDDAGREWRYERSNDGGPICDYLVRIEGKNTLRSPLYDIAYFSIIPGLRPKPQPDLIERLGKRAAAPSTCSIASVDTDDLEAAIDALKAAKELASYIIKALQTECDCIVKDGAGYRLAKDLREKLKG